MTYLRLHPKDLIVAVLMTVVASWSQPSPADAEEPAPSRQAARDDLKKLQGTWECVAMEREGDEVPAESFKGSKAVYEDDLVTLYRESEVFRRGLVTLDASKSPKRTNTWDLGGPYADSTVPGIYELDGDTLKICFSRPGADRPTEFTTKKAPGFLYCVYKRKKP
jgi:uncharacterized protein (TIGR03067 family)